MNVNAAAVLGLISDLYDQIASLRQQLAAANETVARLQQPKESNEFSGS